MGAFADASGYFGDGKDTLVKRLSHTLLALLNRLLQVTSYRLVRVGRTAPPFPPGSDGCNPIPGIDPLSAEELQRLNELLPWNAYVLDSSGRAFGAMASADKRSEPQAIPDYRIVELDRRFPLQGRDVIELGCFEGIHTIGLCSHGANVLAIDGRIENVVKTIVRCAMFGFRPRVRHLDLELTDGVPPEYDCDLLFHCGVLYHLTDPVAHLRAWLPRVRHRVLLDSHYATPDMATRLYASGGTQWRCYRFGENNRISPFAGLGTHANWLLESDLVALFVEAGFEVESLEKRQERNGPRLLLHAVRRGAVK